jgi:hypothetical protein
MFEGISQSPFLWLYGIFIMPAFPAIWHCWRFWHFQLKLGPFPALR